MSYHYSIQEPIKLNWKYVAPKNFTELEYFLTPSLSVGMDILTNGKNNFAIGAFLTGGINKAKFLTDFMVKKSTERIENTFKNERISAFFTPEEAKEMDLLFEEEKFIARKVSVYKNDREIDIFHLDETDFAKVMELFSELGVQQSIEFKSSKDSFEDLRKDMYNEAYKKARVEFNDMNKKKENVQKKDLYIQASKGAGFLVLGSLLKYSGHFLAKKGPLGMIGGAICHLASVVVGIVGLKYTQGALDYYTQGVVFE